MKNRFIAYAIASLISTPLHAFAVQSGHFCNERMPGTLTSLEEAGNLEQCFRGRKYSIIYRSPRVMLKMGGRETVLHTVPKGFEPEKVGLEPLTAFLPSAKQPYKYLGILVYTAAIRSNGGGGGGQCGSGAEIYLHALDVTKKNPRVISNTLIGSCSKSIELEEQDLSLRQLGSMSIQNGRLALKFLNYGTMEGSPTALLSNDFKRLEFSK